MAALINILNSNQKKGFFILTSIMVLNAILEIFTLNFIFIVFNYLSNPGSIENNFLINYFENLDSSFDISIIVLSLFFDISSKKFSLVFLNGEKANI